MLDLEQQGPTGICARRQSVLTYSNHLAVIKLERLNLEGQNHFVPEISFKRRSPSGVISYSPLTLVSTTLRSDKITSTFLIVETEAFNRLAIDGGVWRGLSLRSKRILLAIPDMSIGLLLTIYTYKVSVIFIYQLYV